MPIAPLALTPYQAGRSLGTIVLAVLLVLLLLRAFDVLPRRRPTPHGKLTDLGVAALLGVLLTVAMFDGRADAWDEDGARQLRTAFVAGCDAAAGGAIDCECAFDELTSKAPYDTPEEFAALQTRLTGAVKAGQAPPVPPEYFEVAVRCARSA